MEELAPYAQIDPQWGLWRQSCQTIGRQLQRVLLAAARVTCSLGGELGEGREAMVGRAQGLRTEAAGLVATLVRGEHWVAECGADVAVPGEGEPFPCSLPAGHEGDHDTIRCWSAVERAWQQAGELRGLGEEMADALGELAWPKGRDGGPALGAEALAVLRHVAWQAGCARVMSRRLQEATEALLARVPGGVEGDASMQAAER